MDMTPVSRSLNGLYYEGKNKKQKKSIFILFYFLGEKQLKIMTVCFLEE